MKHQTQARRAQVGVWVYVGKSEEPGIRTPMHDSQSEVYTYRLLIMWFHVARSVVQWPWSTTGRCTHGR